MDESRFKNIDWTPEAAHWYLGCVHTNTQGGGGGVGDIILVKPIIIVIFIIVSIIISISIRTSTSTSISTSISTSYCFVHVAKAKLGKTSAEDNEEKLMMKHAPGWVRTSDPAIRSATSYRWWDNYRYITWEQ